MEPPMERSTESTPNLLTYDSNNPETHTHRQPQPEEVGEGTKHMHQGSLQVISREEEKRKMIALIRKSKDRTLREISELEKEEEEIKIAIKNISKSKSRSLGKSNFSPEDKDRIKQILRMQRQKQFRDKQKHEKIIRSFEQRIQQQKSAEKQQIQKIRHEHRLNVEKNLQKIEIRRKSQQQFKKQISRRALQLKKKKYIHVSKCIQDMQRMKVEEKQKEEKLKQIKEIFKLDLSEIQAHEQHYKSILTEKSAERLNKFKQLPSQSIVKYKPNKFSRILTEQDNKKRIDEARKANRAVQFRQKMRQYRNYVKSNFQPKKSSSSEFHPSYMSTEPRRAVSYIEQVNKGNEYLQVAKKLRKEKDEPKIMKEPQVIKYMNYLKHNDTKSKSHGTAERFRKIVSSQQSIDYQSASKAWSMVYEIDAKSKKGKDQKLFESIQNKIDLLRVLL